MYCFWIAPVQNLSNNSKLGVGGIVSFRIVQRGGDDVRTARPLAQVDRTATVAAEREVGVLAEHDLPASRTT